jgi:hypothetical protein
MHTVEENVYEERGPGVRRLVAVKGQEISDERAAELGLTKGKKAAAKEPPEDKAGEPAADKAKTLSSTKKTRSG